MLLAPLRRHRRAAARSRWLALAVSVVLVLGCDPYARTLGVVPPCAQRILVERITVTPPPRLDLLLVVDDSSSMEDEQRALRREIPRLIRILTTGDVNDDGLRDLERLEDLHVGVIRSDMGSGAYTSSQCPGGRGEDGVLQQTSGVVPGVACESAYPPFVAFPAQSAEDVATAAQCLATVGTEGCSFEQPLEALLKALTPSTAGPIFAEGRVGHGDGANVGFLREDAVLVVVLLTDEDDCSSPDDRLYQIDGGPFPRAVPGRRSGRQPHAAAGPPLRELPRRAVPRRALCRRPAGAAHTRGGACGRGGHAGGSERRVPARWRLRRAARRAAMQERPDPDAPASLVAACTREEGTLTSSATPARRIVRVAEALRAGGGQVVLESICRADELGRADYSSLATGLLAPIAAALGETCLATPLRRLPDDSVRCQMDETLTLGQRCDAVPGRTLTRVDEQGREVCRVTQLVPTREERDAGEAPAGVGWFYDDFTVRALSQCPTTRPQLLNFASTEPTPDAELRIECVFDDIRDSEVPSLGSGCDPTWSRRAPPPRRSSSSCARASGGRTPRSTASPARASASCAARRTPSARWASAVLLPPSWRAPKRATARTRAATETAARVQGRPGMVTP
jgi:hypothetical protein